MPAPLRAYRFGVFELDVQTGQLARKGLKVRVRGQPIQLLEALLESEGRIVSREELRTRLWPDGTHVDFERSLHSVANKLREALGDSADNPRFIETIPKRGYRFVVPVDVVRQSLEEPVAPAVVGGLASGPVSHEAAATTPADRIEERSRTSSPRLPWVLLAVLLAALLAGVAVARRAPTIAVPAAGRIMLAVLPFENLGSSSDEEFFSDGITDDVIAELGGLNPKRLGVIARTTSMQYKHTGKPLGDIGRELNVQYVLEGAVRRAGDRVRITAQLVDVSSQTQLWADAFEGAGGNVLALQRDLGMRVASSLAMEVLDVGGPGVRTAERKVDPEAYADYLRAAFFRQQSTLDGVRKGLDYAEKAIQRDPTFAPAHAVLAECCRFLAAPGYEGGDTEALRARARASVERALELDPALQEAYDVRALIRLDADWDTRGAEQDIRHAIRLNPSQARSHQYYSVILLEAGRLDESVDEAEQAVKLDPLSRAANATLGLRLFYARRYADALTQFERTLELVPDFYVAKYGLGETYLQLGRPDEAIRALNEAVTLSSGDPYSTALLVFAYGTSDRRDAARDALARLRATPATGGTVSPFYYALAHVGLGEDDEALEYLRQAYAERSGWILLLPVQPEFDRLRDNPSFKALVAGIRPRT